MVKDTILKTLKAEIKAELRAELKDEIKTELDKIKIIYFINALINLARSF
jgi:hypothetical protein